MLFTFRLFIGWRGDSCSQTNVGKELLRNFLFWALGPRTSKVEDCKTVLCRPWLWYFDSLSRVVTIAEHARCVGLHVGGSGLGRKWGGETTYSHILRCLTQLGLGKFCQRMRKVAQDPAMCWHQAHVEPVDGCSACRLHLVLYMYSSPWKMQLVVALFTSSLHLITAFLRPSERRARCWGGLHSDQSETEPERCSVLHQVLICTAQCFGQNVVFLFWLNLVTHRNRSECRFDS